LGALYHQGFPVTFPKSPFQGLEEFEEKIDRIAEGEDDGENSWISKIYDQFSFFNDASNSLEDAEMEGIEPPILDETWGLGRETKGHGELICPVLLTHSKSLII
jgi:hypothetical protein